jgi:hypothetical protein
VRIGSTAHVGHEVYPDGMFDDVRPAQASLGELPMDQLNGSVTRSLRSPVIEACACLPSAIRLKDGEQHVFLPACKAAKGVYR